MFRVVETYGIPLELLLERFEQEGLIIDWIEFYQSAIKYGWNIKTIINKIETALIDIKGKQYTDQVMLRLKYAIMQQD